MKTITFKVNFDEQKRRLWHNSSRKRLTLEDETAAYLQKLYEKTVPAQVGNLSKLPRNLSRENLQVKGWYASAVPPGLAPAVRVAGFSAWYQNMRRYRVWHHKCRLFKKYKHFVVPKVVPPF